MEYIELASVAERSGTMLGRHSRPLCMAGLLAAMQFGSCLAPVATLDPYREQQRTSETSHFRFGLSASQIIECACRLLGRAELSAKVSSYLRHA
jgi:hypothetical protein